MVDFLQWGVQNATGLLFVGELLEVNLCYKVILCNLHNSVVDCKQSVFSSVQLDQTMCENQNDIVFC